MRLATAALRGTPHPCLYIVPTKKVARLRLLCKTEENSVGSLSRIADRNERAVSVSSNHRVLARSIAAASISSPKKTVPFFWFVFFLKEEKSRTGKQKRKTKKKKKTNKRVTVNAPGKKNGRVFHMPTVGSAANTIVVCVSGRLWIRARRVPRRECNRATRATRVEIVDHVPDLLA
jgi:hypothetical protein